MVWIKMRVDLKGDPAVVSIGNQLQLEPMLVVGKLHTFWSWVDANCSNGRVTLKRFNPVTLRAYVDQLCGTTGFAAALESVGWLLLKGDEIAIPNFDNHLSETAKKRGLTAKRVAKHRNANVTPTPLPEKRREEKKNTPLPPKGAKQSDPWETALSYMTGDSLKTDAFQEAWSDWVKHRNEIKKKLTPTSMKQQIRKLESWGEKRAIAAIRHTIFKGWQGLRENDEAQTDGPDEFQQMLDTCPEKPATEETK